MAISLVSHIPDHTVFRCVENIMKCHGNLHHTETRCQMTWINSHFLNDVLTQFLTELRQLFHLQLSKIFWILYLT